MENKNVNLKLKRGPFKTKDGQEMFGYYVSGEIHGREIKVDFQAKDVGGYELLELMFGINQDVELIMHDESMTDERGNVTKYTVYEAYMVDEDGIVYTYKLKPSQESDKAYLNILLQKLNRAQA